MMKHAVFLIYIVSMICVVFFYMLYVMYYCLFVYMVCVCVCVLSTYLIFNSINRCLICEKKCMHVCMHACKCAGITNTVMTRLQAGGKYFFLFKLLRPAVSPPSLIFKWHNGSLFPYTTWGAKLNSDVQLLGLWMNTAYTSRPNPIWLNYITLPDKRNPYILNGSYGICK